MKIKTKGILCGLVLIGIVTMAPSTSHFGDKFETIDVGGTTLLQSREIVVDTGGVFNVNIGSASGDDFTVDVTKLVVEGDTGKVGIGTAAPTVKLQVNQANDPNYPTLGTTKGVFFLTDVTGLYGLHTGVHTSEGNVWMQVMRNDAATAYNLLFQPVGGNVGIGDTTPDFKLEVAGSIGLQEMAAAIADEAGTGQIWVGNTTPNELWFTDDAGTDTQISSHPLDAPPALYAYGPGIDWIGKRVQPYLGVIFWQTLNGVVVEESFDDYNARRKSKQGHKDKIKKEWDTVQLAKLKADKMTETIETEVPIEDAFEEVEIMEDVHSGNSKTEYSYEVDNEGKIVVIAKEKAIMTKQGTGKFEKYLKSGISFDSETGKFISKRQRTEAEVDAMHLKAPDMPPWMKTWLQNKGK